MEKFTKKVPIISKEELGKQLFEHGRIRYGKTTVLEKILINKFGNSLKEINDKALKIKIKKPTKTSKKKKVLIWNPNKKTNPHIITVGGSGECKKKEISTILVHKGLVHDN